MDILSMTVIKIYLLALTPLLLCHRTIFSCFRPEKLNEIVTKTNNHSVFKEMKPDPKRIILTILTLDGAVHVMLN